MLPNFFAGLLITRPLTKVFLVRFGCVMSGLQTIFFQIYKSTFLSFQKIISCYEP